MVIIEENVSETYVEGNLLWLRLDVEDICKQGIWANNLLIQKWLSSAEFVLRHRPNLELTWPIIIEYEIDCKWDIELKSEMVISHPEINKAHIVDVSI